MKRMLVTLGSLIILISAGALTIVALRMFEPAAGPPKPTVATTPELKSSKVVTGLKYPWDVDFLPDKTMIFSERSGQLSTYKSGKRTTITAPSDIEIKGEGGMMGIAIDPDFEQNSYIYTCYNTSSGDVKVVRWTLSGGALSARRDIVTGITAADSGRHSGCQVAFGPDKNLWVGTGDAADETQPQDRSKLGGKILRISRDGVPAFDNPDGPDKRVYSYGHRNIQSFTFYSKIQGESYGVSVEHGPDKDDEVNPLSPGNFGWAPGENYNESVPMTDNVRFTDAIPSIWSSGKTTIAASGSAFLNGDEWGRLNGWLAVTALKDQKLLLLNVTNGSVGGERSMFEKELGRLRAATLGPDGALYVSTDNGKDDAIIKITP